MDTDLTRELMAGNTKRRQVSDGHHLEELLKHKDYRYSHLHRCSPERDSHLRELMLQQAIVSSLNGDSTRSIGVAATTKPMKCSDNAYSMNDATRKPHLEA